MRQRDPAAPVVVLPTRRALAIAERPWSRQGPFADALAASRGTLVQSSPPGELEPTD